MAVTFENSWGSPEYLDADVAWRAPSESDNPAFVKWWGVYRRLGASPGAAADLTRLNARIDVRALLVDVRAPTLVLARTGDRVISPEHARYVANRIKGATYLELCGDDHLPFVGDASAFVTAIARMLGVHGDLPIEVHVEPQRAAALGDLDATASLTDRERDILSWVARGKTNTEIATALYIAESTVRKHLQNTYKKLDVSNRTAAAALLRGGVQ
jgi:DNA-binding CsgD family transcriptional regulator